MERILEVLAGVAANQRTFMTFVRDVTSGQARLDNGQHHLHTMMVQLLAHSAEISGRLDSMQEHLFNPPPRSTAVRIVDKVLEWGPKIASNWAPISAFAVALYKFGVPYLRQLLGSP